MIVGLYHAVKANENARFNRVGAIKCLNPVDAPSMGKTGQSWLQAVPGQAGGGSFEKEQANINVRNTEVSHPNFL